MINEVGHYFIMLNRTLTCLISFFVDEVVKINLLTLPGFAHDKACTVEFLQQKGILHDPGICANDYAMMLQI